jgi:phosphoglycerate dehydrogenase-like enzyme
VLDEDALVQALADGEIAGAALDVFMEEPLPPGNRLWKTDKVIVTPHMAGFNDGYAAQALEVIIENMKRFLAGDTDNLINLVEQ